MTHSSNARLGSKWERRFLRLANNEIAGWSKDPSSKVGCVLVSPDRDIVIPGYNGFPPGIADTTERYADRELKYQLVQHAERNALRKLGYHDVGYHLFCTHMPCPQCVGGAISAKVTSIVWLVQQDYEQRWADMLDISWILMTEANILAIPYAPAEIIEK
jgi:dCMP deaminase